MHRCAVHEPDDAAVDHHLSGIHSWQAGFCFPANCCNLFPGGFEFGNRFCTRHDLQHPVLHLLHVLRRIMPAGGNPSDLIAPNWETAVIPVLVPKPSANGSTNPLIVAHERYGAIAHEVAKNRPSERLTQVVRVSSAAFREVSAAVFRPDVPGRGDCARRGQMTENILCRHT